MNMHKLGKFLALTLSFIALLYTSCVDENSPFIPVDNVFGRWQQFAGDLNPAVNGVISYFDTLADCKKDDILEILVDENFSLLEGAMACDTLGIEVIESGTLIVGQDTVAINFDGQPNVAFTSIFFDGDSALFRVEDNGNTLILRSIINDTLVTPDTTTVQIDRFTRLPEE